MSDHHEEAHFCRTAGEKIMFSDAIIQAMVLLQAAGAPSVGLVTEGPAAKK